MPLDLKASHLTFHLHDDSGYAYSIDAVYDPEFGWQASVSISSHGMSSSDAAIKHLRQAAKAFLRQLDETYGKEE